MSSQALSRDDAAAHCASYGAHLARVYTRAQFDRIYDIVSASFDAATGLTARAWVDGERGTLNGRGGADDWFFSTG